MNTDTPTPTMAADTAALIAKARADLLALEAKHADEQKAKLTSLPAQVGCKSINELVRALMPYTKGLSLREAAPVTKAPKGKKAKSGAKGARISDEVRAKIISDLQAGGMTGKAVAQKYGVAVPTIALIKRKAGLTAKK